ncbi:GumC family protein [Bosea vestrisii]|uniref:GumC family protein n=1 Tax=Bosea vestrisii TaxID=151416 RepID=UPI0024E016D7|nr:GumC family protein [Bosea vestrisii]WID96382.1 GumC family protein [Bosea vestrisii]
MTARYDTVAAAGESRSDLLDLPALWAAIKARKLWIIGPTLAALGLSFIAVNAVTPRYTGEARLLLENRDSFYTRPGQAPSESSGQQFDSEGVQSQVQVIMSRDLAREAIKRIGLVGNSEFDSGAGALGALKKVGVLLGIGAHPADRSPEERVLEKYYDRLLVFPVGRSRIVSIEFTSQDPALAAKAANEIAAVYLEMQEAAKQDTARSASSWLSTTIEPLRKRLAESEAKVEEFRSRHGLLVGANNTTITAQQLADLSTQLSNARNQQAESQAKASIIRDAIKAGRTFEIPDVANNDLVRRLIEQRVNLRAQLALESRNLLSEHPRIKELNAQLADLEGQIRAAAERAVRTLENEAKIAGQRVESVTAALEGQKKTASGANDDEVQLRALEREARTQRDQLEQYMLRYREALARDSLNATPADARVISRAIEPTEPSFPKKLPTMLVATLATFLVALAAVVSRELLNGGSPAPAEDAPRRRAPGRVEPAVGSEEEGDEVEAAAPPPRRRERIAGLLTHGGRIGQLHLDLTDPDAGAAELAACVNKASEGHAPLVLVLDGAEPGEASPRALALLLSERSRCILVDLASDGRDRAGFSELLAGEAMFSDIITREEDSRLHEIAPGRAGRHAVLAAPDIVDVALDALCETYDWVLVAAASTDEAEVLSPLLARAQGALVMAGHAGNGHAVEAAYRLTDLTGAPIALIMVDAPERVELAVQEKDPVPA